jgi:hypothetical protein
MSESSASDPDDGVGDDGKHRGCHPGEGGGDDGGVAGADVQRGEREEGYDTG